MWTTRDALHQARVKAEQEALLEAEVQRTYTRDLAELLEQLMEDDDDLIDMLGRRILLPMDTRYRTSGTRSISTLATTTITLIIITVICLAITDVIRTRSRMSTQRRTTSRPRQIGRLPIRRSFHPRCPNRHARSRSSQDDGCPARRWNI